MHGGPERADAWIPAFAGMTAEHDPRALPLSFTSPMGEVDGRRPAGKGFQT